MANLTIARKEVAPQGATDAPFTLEAELFTLARWGMARAHAAIVAEHDFLWPNARPTDIGGSRAPSGYWAGGR